MARTYTSYEEIIVFKLEENYLRSLVVAYQAYECLIDIIVSAHFSGEILGLIQKARGICPSAKWFEHEKEFETGCDEKQWFAWFAKLFLDIPYRQSCAYHDKRNYNLLSLSVYADEERIDA